MNNSRIDKSAVIVYGNSEMFLVMYAQIPEMGKDSERVTKPL